MSHTKAKRIYVYPTSHFGTVSSFRGHVSRRDKRIQYYSESLSHILLKYHTVQSPKKIIRTLSETVPRYPLSSHPEVVKLIHWCMDMFEAYCLPLLRCGTTGFSFWIMTWVSCPQTNPLCVKKFSCCTYS